MHKENTDTHTNILKNWHTLKPTYTHTHTPTPQDLIAADEERAAQIKADHEAAELKAMQDRLQSL